MNNHTINNNFVPNFQRFINLVDFLSEKQGKNVTQIVYIEQLRLLPIGTFGRAWADFLDSNNLQPFTNGLRRKQLHDGVHILTGYNADAIGEAELQAFLLGAKFIPIHILIILGLLKPISQQLSEQTSKNLQQSIYKRLWQAYQRGRNSHFDPDKWQPELLWKLPLEQVQVLYKL